MGILFSAEQENHMHFQLEQHSVQFNTAEQVAPGCEELLKYKDEVTMITLSRNSYSTEACQYMAGILEHCQNLQIANFSDMFTSRLRPEVVESMQVISSALLKIDTLEEIDFSDNAFGPDGVRSLCGLLSGQPNLKVVKVNNNGLGPQGGELIGLALAQNEGRKLEVFEACRNRLENEGAIAISKAFQQLTTLKKVNMMQNGIKNEGMTAVLEALKPNQILQMLELQDNNLKYPESQRALIELVSSLEYLSILSLNDCLIGNEASLQLIKALQNSNPNLLRLHIAYNEIDQSNIAEELIILASQRENLEFIEIKGNEFAESVQDQLTQQFEDLGKKSVLGPFESDDEDLD